MQKESIRRACDFNTKTNGPKSSDSLGESHLLRPKTLTFSEDITSSLYTKQCSNKKVPFQPVAMSFFAQAVRPGFSFRLFFFFFPRSVTISYLESSFLTAHGLTKRTTLERSVREAVLIGCSKTMQMTGSKSEIQYGGQNATKNCLQAWTVNVCKCCNNFVFESKHPVDLYWPKVTKESILLLL